MYLFVRLLDMSILLHTRRVLVKRVRIYSYKAELFSISRLWILRCIMHVGVCIRILAVPHGYAQSTRI